MIGRAPCILKPLEKGEEEHCGDSEWCWGRGVCGVEVYKAAGPVWMDFLCHTGLQVGMLYTCELASAFTQQTVLDPC